MPLLISQRLGVTPKHKNQIVIQLNKMVQVKVIGVLKDVPIQLTTDHGIKDIINIHLVDSPGTYNMLLSKEGV